MLKSPKKSAEQALSLKKVNAVFLEQLRQSKTDIDSDFHDEHKAVFKELDCLECANCCKTTSPIFLQEDIGRISSYLKIKVGHFISKYLEMDEDGDFVLQKAPCAFLAEDNKCKIYDVRPKACSEYPHTNRKNMIEILDITLENTVVCPAVNEIVKRMRSKL
jgi:Fe-S-cluster containining protein|tara:strand:+ start:1897 stop:2382 length:486 start_codon:yes stop_codon:yes gene_type:complete